LYDIAPDRWLSSPHEVAIVKNRVGYAKALENSDIALSMEGFSIDQRAIEITYQQGEAREIESLKIRRHAFTGYPVK
jgi:hypothetical protein